MAPRDEGGSGLAGAAGRAALYPARVAARAWRGQVESVADDLISTPEFTRILDRALSGPLPEELARSLVRHRVLERALEELAASGELERMVSAALASERTLQVTDQVLGSDEMQLALRRIASSPELREAVGRQTAGFADEVLGRVRGWTRALDVRVERLVHRHRVEGRSAYGGIVSRALALAVDAIIVTVFFEVAVGIVAIVASLAGGLHPAWLVATLLSVAWVLCAGGYFVGFWTAGGVTPGMRLLRLRVQTAATSTPSLARSIVRLIGLVFSIAILFAGFIPILFDRRRRGLADFLAGTVVLDDDRPS